MNTGMRHTFGNGRSFIETITDLAVSEQTALALELSFTIPLSSHQISHYEVYINGSFSQNIKSNNEFIVYLTEQSSYIIKIKAVDVKNFKSELSNEITSSTNSNYINQNADEIFSLIQRIPTATKAVRIQREGDLAETDVLFSGVLNEFISINSQVSAGGTFANWIGSDSANVLIFYGQKGLSDAVYYDDNPELKFKLVNNGFLNLVNNKPCIHQESLTNSLESRALLTNNLNGGTRLKNLSIFQASQHTVNNNNTRPLSFGSFIDAYPSYNGINFKREHFGTTADNSIRYDGGTTQGLLSLKTNVVRSSFRKDLDVIDYINEELNINSKVSNLADTVDFLHIGYIIKNNLGRVISEFKISEAVIFLSEQIKYQKVIENEINDKFQYYATQKI